MTQLSIPLKEVLKSTLLRIPYFKKVYEAYSSCPWPPGHFYSTIPAIEEVEKNKKRIFENQTIKDIKMNPEEQFLLAQDLKQYYDSMPFQFDDTKASNLRYQSKDSFYRFSDAVFLYCFLRHFQPKRIIEVGSGHSSAIMLDTNELYFQNKIKLSFIEPYPEERLNKILRKNDDQCSNIHKNFVQDIDPVFFEALNENDILFIDSTHVSKVGSDVNYIFFDVFPVLKPGVLIHIHDIFFPFELPPKWILEEKFFWNEIYILRAFLMNNNDYEIVMFNSFVQRNQKKWFETNMPICLKGDEFTGSIWLRKIIK